MNKILILLALCCLVVACSGVKKPPLSETQIVDGKSIVIPPEFDVLPDTPKKETVKADKKETVKSDKTKKSVKKQNRKKK